METSPLPGFPSTLPAGFHDENGSELVFRPEYLTFLLGRKLFAMPVEGMREIVACPPLTVVPGMPEFLRGVMNLRGGVVPVIDLRVRLGLAPAVFTRRSCIVIMELDHHGRGVAIGVLVDVVQAVLSADDEAAGPDGPGVESGMEDGGDIPPGTGRGSAHETRHERGRETRHETASGGVPREFIECELMLDGRRTLLLDTARALSINELREQILQ